MTQTHVATWWCAMVLLKIWNPTCGVCVGTSSHSKSRCPSFAMTRPGKHTKNYGKSPCLMAKKYGRLSDLKKKNRSVQKPKCPSMLFCLGFRGIPIVNDAKKSPRRWIEEPPTIISRGIIRSHCWTTLWQTKKWLENALSEMMVPYFPLKKHIDLVGGFNPSEKY